MIKIKKGIIRTRIDEKYWSGSRGDFSSLKQESDVENIKNIGSDFKVVRLPTLGF